MQFDKPFVDGPDEAAGRKGRISDETERAKWEREVDEC